ncbi:MAG: lytic murein transglycosylase, partial [Pseudomonadota bacterium]|nr:lytic murein transglycosylase [Pseudomonadota bacterium]
MPTTFINYAVDGDGDGRVQLWQSVPDAMASAANYLHSIGWNREERWGREVRLPANLDWRRAALDLDERAPLTRWRELGVRQAADGALVPALDIDASLILPAGMDGPAFLVYENFHHVMHWNRSRFYALTVGLLADRIAGEPPLAWTPRSTTAGLRGSDVQLIQQALIARGYELGKADGRLGGATRAAIRRFELAAGLPADGWPDPTLKAMLAQNL